MDLFQVVVFAALLGALGALVMGIYSMARGGSYDVQHSEQFMSARVGMQGIALVLVLAALYLASV